MLPSSLQSLQRHHDHCEGSCVILQLRIDIILFCRHPAHKLVYYCLQRTARLSLTKNTQKRRIELHRFNLIPYRRGHHVRSQANEAQQSVLRDPSNLWRPAGKHLSEEPDATDRSLTGADVLCQPHMTSLSTAQVRIVLGKDLLVCVSSMDG